MFSLLIGHFQLESAVVHETPEGAVDLGSGMEETEVRHIESQRMLFGLYERSGGPHYCTQVTTSSKFIFSGLIYSENSSSQCNQD